MIECNCMIPVMNYGSSASYKAEPSPEQIANGVIPLDSLPAAWWNCMWSQTNTAVNQARQELGQLIVELNNVLCNAGVCPQDICTDQLYQSIEKIRQTLGNATTAGAVKSSDTASEVKIDQTTGMMSVNCLGNAASLTTSARTVVGAVNELKSTYDQCFTDTGTALSGKAPTSHVSDATTYGVGNADCYGHLKISDTYTCDLGCTGMAASQSALYCVYNFAAGIAEGVASLGNTAGCALGTASAGTAVTAARSDHVHPYPAYVYHDTYTGNSDRPIMVTSDNDYSAAGYYNQGTVRSGCNFTYNPATGMLKLKSYGKTACISHQNATYLHIYTDASCIAFNKSIYLPAGYTITCATGATTAARHCFYYYNGRSSYCCAGLWRACWNSGYNSGEITVYNLSSVNPLIFMACNACGMWTCLVGPGKCGSANCMCCGTSYVGVGLFSGIQVK